MKLKPTLIERVVLANQFKILAFLDPANKSTYENNAEIFENGYESLYLSALPLLYSEGISEDIGRETHEILTMYRAINNAIDKLTAAEKSSLDLRSLAFNGFDGNNDHHYHFASFLIDKQKLYAEHSGQDINSHNVTSIEKYRKMLPIYKRSIHGSDTLTKDDLQELIDSIEIK